MALAPRPDAINPSRESTGHGAAGKRAQRERNKNAPNKGLTQRSGSSGNARSIAQFPKIDMADLEDVLVHLCDIAAKMNHLQVGSGGWQTSNLNIPLAYAHDVLEAHMASQQGMIFLKIYYCPMEVFLPLDEGDDNAE